MCSKRMTKSMQSGPRIDFSLLAHLLKNPLCSTGGNMRSGFLSGKQPIDRPIFLVIISQEMQGPVSQDGKKISRISPARASALYKTRSFHNATINPHPAIMGRRTGSRSNIASADIAIPTTCNADLL